MKYNTTNKLKTISLNTLRQILTSGFGVLIPIVIIEKSSSLIWGEIVAIMLFVLFATTCINWGNKEYLLRLFSKNPSKIKHNFTNFTVHRFWLFLLFLACVPFIFSTNYFWFILLWLSGRFLINSTEVLIVYFKTFKWIILVEITSFLLLYFAFILMESQIDFKTAIIYYSLYQFIKGVAYIIRFKDQFLFSKIAFNLKTYKNALPFLLLSLIGFLASKADVYLVGFFLNKTTLGHYQIINSLLIFIMSISAFIYSPFVKNLYRANQNLVDNSKQSLAILGLIIVPLGLLVVHFIIINYFVIDVGYLFYISAFMFIYPSYLYGLDIIKLFKAQKEQIVTLYLSIGVAVNLVLSYLLLQLNYGITGALLGSAIAQLIILSIIKLKKSEPIS